MNLMPDAAGNIKGIVLSGKAGETLEKIRRQSEHEPACALSDSDCKTHRKAFPECGCSKTFKQS